MTNGAASNAGACSRLLLAILVYLFAGIPRTHAQDAATLKARHTALREQLANNQFQRPIYLESTEQSGDVKGDIYAVIEQPFAVVSPALQGMNQWCDILILHLNVKSCRPSSPAAGDTLILHMGRKFDQPLTDAHAFEFLYTVEAAGPDYLQVMLKAEDGPMGTSRYRVMLEVAELDASRSFLHLSYAYTYGTRARVAMRAYLSTIGRDKVGFSITGHKPDGQPIYEGGMRGAVERNTMRYYLAIEAYLGALSVPGPKQLDKRLRDWHAGVERYPLQLHELELDEYLDMKHKEIQRQEEPDAAATPR